MTLSEYKSKRRAAYRRQRIAEGICHDCGSINDNGKTVCDECLKKRHNYYMAHKDIYIMRAKRRLKMQKGAI